MIDRYDANVLFCRWRNLLSWFHMPRNTNLSGVYCYLGIWFFLGLELPWTGLNPADCCLSLVSLRPNRIAAIAELGYRRAYNWEISPAKSYLYFRFSQKTHKEDYHKGCIDFACQPKIATHIFCPEEPDNPAYISSHHPIVTASSMHKEV